MSQIRGTTPELAAARRGCAVIGLDYVPALLERARPRAEAEGSTTPQAGMSPAIA